jgi:uncharacterized membrane protein (UPF0127 family)
LLRLINRRTGHTIASAVEVADTRRSRNRGLLGRDSLDPESALVLTPCCSIHTASMRFAIDVVFVDRDGGVLRIVHALRPWRAAWAVRAHAVIELAAGRLRPDDLLVGDAVYLVPDPEADVARSSAATSRTTASNPA